ncbi:MAG: hypothetical protein WKF35_09605 [Ferruginibacter sp.]
MNNASNKASIQNPFLKTLETLFGEWKTVGTHPQFNDTILHGHASFKWIEGGAFLIIHSEIYHNKFPDTISFFGSDNSLGEYFMLSFDEREVSRKHVVFFQDNVLKWWRNTTGFSQLYTFTFTDNGNTIISKGELSKK